MKKDLMKRVIIDVQNEGCPEAHIAPLLDCFESLMATAASASCRRAYYELGDLTLASRKGLGAYSIEIERMMDNPALKNTDHVWTGIFTDGHNSLKVMGCLEAC
jgi:hypothetical protein